MSISCEKEFTITVPDDVGFYAYYQCEEDALPLVDRVGEADFTTQVNVGEILSTTGRVNNGLYLAQGSDFLNCRTDATDRFSFDGEFTVRLWIYYSGTDAFMDVINNDLNGDYSFQFDLVNDSPGVEHVDFTVYDSLNNGHLVSSAALTVGWHRLIGSYDGSTVSLKLDDTAAVTTPNGDGLYDPPDPGLVLGSTTLQLPNNYKLDEIAIWERILTADEMTDDWNSGNGTTYPTI